MLNYQIKMSLSCCSDTQSVHFLFYLTDSSREFQLKNKIGQNELTLDSKMKLICDVIRSNCTSILLYLRKDVKEIQCVYNEMLAARK